MNCLDSRPDSGKHGLRATAASHLGLVMDLATVSVLVLELGLED